MRNLIITGVAGLILGAIIMYFVRSSSVETIKVPVRVEVPVPGVRDSFPYDRPVLKPYPVTNPTNKKLEKELAQAKTMIDSFKTLKDFTKPKLYSKTFTDKVQSIKVDMIATGSVDNVKVDYNIFPKTIVLDTVVNVNVPRQASIWGGLSTGIPFGESPFKPTVKPELAFKNKRDNVIYKVNADFVNKIGELGILFKF